MKRRLKIRRKLKMTSSQPKICMSKWNEWGKPLKERSKKERRFHSDPVKRKSCGSTVDAVEYLKEKASKETVLKEQELELRKKEQESMAKGEKERYEQVNCNIQSAEVFLRNETNIEGALVKPTPCFLNFASFKRQSVVVS